MNDLISRQAAIDAIQQHREDVLGGYEYDEGVAFVYAAAHNHIIDVIKHLPSAQPDGIPLEWIDKHLEWLDNCDNDFAQLAKVSIRAMVEIWKKDKT